MTSPRWVLWTKLVTGKKSTTRLQYPCLSCNTLAYRKGNTPFLLKQTRALQIMPLKLRNIRWQNRYNINWNRWIEKKNKKRLIYELQTTFRYSKNLNQIKTQTLYWKLLKKSLTDLKNCIWKKNTEIEPTEIRTKTTNYQHYCDSKKLNDSFIKRLSTRQPARESNCNNCTYFF